MFGRVARQRSTSLPSAPVNEEQQYQQRTVAERPSNPLSRVFSGASVTEVEATLEKAERMLDEGDYRACRAMLKRFMKGNAKHLVRNQEYRASKALARCSLQLLAYKEAVPMTYRSAELAKEIFSDHSDEYIRAVNLVAMAELGIHHEPAASALLSQAEKILEDMEWKSHPTYALIQCGKAMVLMDEKNWEAALARFQHARDILDFVKTTDINYARTLNNMSVCYHRLGQSGARGNCLSECLRSYRTIVGPEHPNYATAASNLGHYYLQESRFTEAIQVYEEALVIFKKRHGSDHPVTKMVKEQLSVAQAMAKGSRPRSASGSGLRRLSDRLSGNLSHAYMDMIDQEEDRITDNEGGDV